MDLLESMRGLNVEKKPEEAALFSFFEMVGFCFVGVFSWRGAPLSLIAGLVVILFLFECLFPLPLLDRGYILESVRIVPFSKPKNVY